MITKKNQQKAISNYNAYLVACFKMRVHPKISLAQLQRTLRPFCKTQLSNDVHLYIRFKFTEISFGITMIDSFESLPWSYFRVYSSSYSNLEILFSARSTKELILKINQKLEKLKPFPND
ncbi:hypothetical protein [Flavobacterium sp. TSSA_36]|uniref:hypothetical protein n=1 Tax=Flavobacterium sp. TSSA_36 TaxID=3447669 RepID=UPI003F38A478